MEIVGEAVGILVGCSVGGLVLTGIGWVEYWVEMVGAAVGILVGYSVGGLV